MYIKSGYVVPKYYFQEIEKDFLDLKVSLFMDHIPTQDELKINPYNFLLLHEPNEFFGFHKFAVDYHSYFSGILTYNQYLIDTLPNAIKFHFGLIQSQDTEYYKSFETKSKIFEVSFLCGVKDLVEGHKLRQSVYPLHSQINNIPIKWYYTLPDFDSSTKVRPGYPEYSKSISHIPDFEAPEQYGKRILFEDSMFHIAIENVKHNNWYTEKIAQAFASKTLPIYWGCPNLNELGYDSRGIIYFSTKEELLDILNNLTPQDYYNRLSYIEHNYQVSLLDTFKSNLTSFFQNLKTLNNL